MFCLISMQELRDGYEKQLLEKQKEFSDMYEDKIKKLQDKLDEAKMINATSINDVQEMTTKVSALTSRNVELKAQNVELKASNASLQKKVAKLKKIKGRKGKEERREKEKERKIPLFFIWILMDSFKEGGYLYWVSLISIWVVLTASLVSFATVGLTAALAKIAVTGRILKKMAIKFWNDESIDFERALLRAEYPKLMKLISYVI